MSEQEVLSELEKRTDLVSMIRRMVNEIAELKARVAQLEGQVLPGCKTCQYVAVGDGLHPVGTSEAVVYTCPDCMQQYSLDPNKGFLESEAASHE